MRQRNLQGCAFGKPIPGFVNSKGREERRTCSFYSLPPGLSSPTSFPPSHLFLYLPNAFSMFLEYFISAISLQSIVPSHPEGTIIYSSSSPSVVPRPTPGNLLEMQTWAPPQTYGIRNSGNRAQQSLFLTSFSDDDDAP